MKLKFIKLKFIKLKFIKDIKCLFCINTVDKLYCFVFKTILRKSVPEFDRNF